MEQRFRHKRKIIWIMLLTMLCSAACLEPVTMGNSNRVVHLGKLLFNNQMSANEGMDSSVFPDPAGMTGGFQSDQPESTVESKHAYLKLQSLSPSVECGNDSMTLNIQGSRVPNFFTDSGEGTSVPLDQLPSLCGFSVKRARRDVALVAKYNGCNVAQQGNSYVLPLRLWGSRVRMACPVVTSCPSVSCTSSAMVITIGVSTDGVKLKVNDVWQPLSQTLSTCGFTLEAAGSGGTITVPYTSSCLRTEGVKTLLSLLYANEELAISCPVLPPATAATISPTTDSPLPVQDPVFPFVPDPPVPHFPKFPYGYPMPQGGYPWVPQMLPPNYFTTTAPMTSTTMPAPVAVPWPPLMYNPFGPMQSPVLPAPVGSHHKKPKPWSNWPLWQYPMPGSSSVNPFTGVNHHGVPEVPWPMYYPIFYKPTSHSSHTRDQVSHESLQNLPPWIMPEPWRFPSHFSPQHAKGH